MAETFYNDYVQINKYSRPGIKLHAVRKLVIHYTANRGATAEGHQDYFDGSDGGAGRYAGAHIFADRDSAVCIIPLDEVGYHANDGSYKGVPELKPNANFLSIGIEMCIERDGSFHPDTVKRTEAVAAELCKMFGLNPLNDIVRHYDITRKLCPLPWVENGSLFTSFKRRVAAIVNSQRTAQPSTEESIVDYLNAKGQDSSFPARAKLAAAYGIPNYSGTAAQNTQLLELLKADKPSTVKQPEVKTATQPPKEEVKVAEPKNNEPSAWAEEYIDEAVKIGLTDGSRPKDALTREEGIVLVMRGLGLAPKLK